MGLLWYVQVNWHYNTASKTKTWNKYLCVRAKHPLLLKCFATAHFQWALYKTTNYTTLENNIIVAKLMGVELQYPLVQLRFVGELSWQCTLTNILFCSFSFSLNRKHTTDKYIYDAMFRVYILDVLVLRRCIMEYILFCNFLFSLLNRASSSWKSVQSISVLVPLCGSQTWNISSDRTY